MQDLIAKVRNNAANAKPFGGIIKFDTMGNGVMCIDGNGDAVQVDDVDRAADTTIILSQENLKKLLGGKLNPAMAVMSGKLKVQGDMALAFKLAALL